jgi:RNA polymerase sigma factor (sigma-70 family)
MARQEPGDPSTSRCNPEASKKFETLIDAARAGSNEAAAEVWRQYGPYIEYVVRRHLRAQQDASIPGGSSVIQESNLDVAEGIRHFKGHTPEQLRAWIRKVVDNNWSDAQRRRARMRKVGLADAVPLDDLPQNSQPASHHPKPCDEIEHREELEAMQAALESLPETPRTVVALHYAENRSYKQIAERTGRSAKAVQKMCERALKHLRRKLRTGE